MKLGSRSRIVKLMELGEEEAQFGDGRHEEHCSCIPAVIIDLTSRKIVLCFLSSRVESDSLLKRRQQPYGGKSPKNRQLCIQKMWLVYRL